MAPIEGPSRRNATPIPPLSADVKYIVCREVCIPGKAHLMLAAPAGAADWAAWRASSSSKHGRSFQSPYACTGWKVTAAADKQHFMLTVRARPQVASASFFPLEPSQIDNSSPQDFARTRTGFRLTLKKSDQLTRADCHLSEASSCPRAGPRVRGCGSRRLRNRATATGCKILDDTLGDELNNEEEVGRPN
jgi:DsbC/DsbD-like thiol-disulfide interchange protein